MRLLKLVPIFALTLGLFFSANAGTPKGEAKDVKAEAPSPKVTSDDVYTYYVTGQNATQYQLSTNPPEEGTCGDGSLPCEITSTTPLAAIVAKSAVLSNPDVTIQENRVSIPAF